jgi:hypothetical protein
MVPIEDEIAESQQAGLGVGVDEGVEMRAAEVDMLSGELIRPPNCV